MLAARTSMMPFTRKVTLVSLTVLAAVLVSLPSIVRDRKASLAAVTSATAKCSPPAAVHLSGTSLSGSSHALAVDEGPGISGTLARIDLPPVFTNTDVAVLSAKACAHLLWQRQDEARMAWPTYWKMEQDLRRELPHELTSEGVSIANLLAAAALLRSEFWDKSGDLSPGGYGSIYRSRCILETARRRAPGDPLVLDELAETLQAASPLRIACENGRAPVCDANVIDILLEIRDSQFCQMTREIDGGRAPLLRDFTRAVDLAVLRSLRDPPDARRVLQWLRQHASAGGWNGYAEFLQRCDASAAAGHDFNGNIYLPKTPDFPNDYRCARRLPSFRGWRTEGGDLFLWGRDDHGAAVILAAKRLGS